jgi:phosphoenolpyruvate-protein phosphotransferase
MASEPSDLPAATGDAVARPAGGIVLRGSVVAPGLVLGAAHRKDFELAHVPVMRVAAADVERELNRLRKALDIARKQVEDLRARLEGKVREDDARVLDTHLLYLKDSVFIADVEKLILTEQLSLEAAIARVIGDFDRIFRLVESETLRQSAIDLRDVGLRVLRSLESASKAGEEGGVKRYVLVARELSIVDMFNVENESVLGIATEEGALTSHAAVFARSMRIPTLVGVEGLLDAVQEGDYLILDASEGVLRINPDERVRAQYQQQGDAKRAPTSAARPEWARFPVRTRDGQQVHVLGACGNLPEVEQCASLGMSAIALYRTELLFLVEKNPPSRDALAEHYRAVLEAAGEAPVTFRLLNADSGLALDFLHGEREPNPALGLFGVRGLLARESILRRQLQALLLASAGGTLRLCVPGVGDCGELRRVKECLFEEKLELRKANAPLPERVEVGIVLETPVSLLGVRELARESDHLLLGFDALQQYLLAADRENPAVGDWFEALHPFALRSIAKIAAVAAELSRPLVVFGEGLARADNLPLLVGAGLRQFAFSPAVLRDQLARLRALEVKSAQRAVRLAASATCTSEMSSLVSGYRHGWARGT